MSHSSFIASSGGADDGYNGIFLQGPLHRGITSVEQIFSDAQNGDTYMLFSSTGKKESCWALQVNLSDDGKERLCSKSFVFLMFRLKRRNGWMMGRSPLASRATYIERAMEASASGVVRGVVGGGDAEDGDGRGHRHGHAVRIQGRQRGYSMHAMRDLLCLFSTTHAYDSCDFQPLGCSKRQHHKCYTTSASSSSGLF